MQWEGFGFSILNLVFMRREAFALRSRERSIRGALEGVNKVTFSGCKVRKFDQKFHKVKIFRFSERGQRSREFSLQGHYHIKMKSQGHIISSQGHMDCSLFAKSTFISSFVFN